MGFSMYITKTASIGNSLGFHCAKKILAVELVHTAKKPSTSCSKSKWSLSFLDIKCDVIEENWENAAMTAIDNR